jgi:multidrug resistance efflux pump
VVVLAVAVVLALSSLGSGYVLIEHPFRHTRTDLVTHKVKYGRMELTIVERGALESSKNNDVYCRLKARNQGQQFASTIKTVIDDGSQVRKNDLLVELDDSGLIEQLKTEKTALDKAESDKIAATEKYKITLSQNTADIKAAETDVEYAKITLQKYQEGDYPQKLKDYQGQVKVAESDVEQQRERAAWANRMVKKGYYTETQGQSEQSRLDSLDLTLKKLQEQLRVLIDPVYGERKQQETDLKNKLAVAESKLLTVKSQALAKDVTDKTDRDTKKSLYEQELTKFKDIEDEIKKCKIYAPQDGMVVYYIPEQARFGFGAQQSIVAQGEQVREGQKLMQIPDLDHMIVNAKVHEAMVSRVHTGLAASIRTDAFPDQLLRGHVDQVATVSSQQDFLSADVKVYATKVAIDQSLPGLKPGMSAEVTIKIGDALEHVLTVPVEAIVGSAEMGEHRTCFVLTPDGPVEKAIVVGVSNETVAEVKDGLKEGDEVVLNPKTLVGDRIKTRQPGSEKKTASDENGAGAGAVPRAPGAAPGRGGPGAGQPTQPGAGAPNGGAAGPQSGAGGGQPGAQPGKAGAAGAGGAGQVSPEAAKKWFDDLKKAKPEQRKKMLEAIPADKRGQVKEFLKGQGIDVPD